MMHDFFKHLLHKYWCDLLIGQFPYSFFIGLLLTKKKKKEEEEEKTFRICDNIIVAERTHMYYCVNRPYRNEDCSHCVFTLESFWTELQCL